MRLICAVLAAATVLAGAGAATAVSAPPHQIAPGVFADPSTPAGKEYALQLQQARGTGSPPPTAKSHASSPSLFGAGIAPAKSTAKSQPPAKPTTRRDAGASTSHRSSATTATKPTATSDRVAAPPAAGSSSGGGTLALVGGAAAILALGGLGGVLMRRRRLEPTSDRGIR
jgi:hypothetical protein